MANIYLVLILTSATILQTTVVNQFVFLNGSADIVLISLIAWVLQSPIEINWVWGIFAGILIGVSSFLPTGVAIVGYVAVVLLIDLLLSRVWHAPILILFAIVFAGTLIINSIDLLYLWVVGGNITFDLSINRVILPSLMLNMGFALPIYALVKEVIYFSFPEVENEQ